MKCFKLHIVLLFIILNGFSSYGQIPWTVDYLSSQQHQIVITSDSLSLVGTILGDLEQGDGIGAFFYDGDTLKCAGYVEWDSTMGNTLVIYGPSTTDATFGHQVGEQLRFKHWNLSVGCASDISNYRASNAGAAVRSSLFFTNGSTDTLTVIDRHFVSFSYTTTYSCNDISDTLEPLIRDIHNFSDESTFYTYTASPTGLAIADSNGFIVLNQSQSNTYTISLQTEYCTDDNTFELPVYPNLNPDAGNGFVFTEQLFCGQDSVTITIDSAFFERGSSASNAIYITNDLSNLEQTNLPSQSITLAEGNYFLSIRNQFGPTCRDTFKVEVLDFCNIQEDENKPILAPNQTGDYQEFAISDTGNVTIFNKEGRLMNRFEAPVIWDGANSNGQSLPTGLYFIILDDKKKYEITIVR